MAQERVFQYEIDIVAYEKKSAVPPLSKRFPKKHLNFITLIPLQRLSVKTVRLTKSIFSKTGSISTAMEKNGGFLSLPKHFAKRKRRRDSQIRLSMSV